MWTKKTNLKPMIQAKPNLTIKSAGDLWIAMWARSTFRNMKNICNFRIMIHQKVETRTLVLRNNQFAESEFPEKVRPIKLEVRHTIH